MNIDTWIIILFNIFINNHGIRHFLLAVNSLSYDINFLSWYSMLDAQQTTNIFELNLCFDLESHFDS